MSDYVRSIRARIGHDLLLLPGVTAVIRDENRYLLARDRDTGLWGLVGGGIEPDESPEEAVTREVLEEIGARPSVLGIVGAYGGPKLQTSYPNGDQVSYVTIAYRCTIPADVLRLERAEIIETRWVERDDISRLGRHTWIDQVLLDDQQTNLRE